MAAPDVPRSWVVRLIGMRGSSHLIHPQDCRTIQLFGAGGHIHFGWTEDADTTDLQHMMNGFDLVKQLDWFLGAWSVKHDKDVERRRLYGKAGACRIKPYGVEYRVLSNFWVMDKALRLEVWNRMVSAIETMSKTTYADSVGSTYNQLVREAINGGKIHPGLLSTYKYPVQTLLAAYQYHNFPQGSAMLGAYLDQWIKDNPSGGLRRKQMNSPKFNKFRPFELGMYWAGTKVYYVERQPTRRTEQGLTPNMLVTTRVSAGKSEGDIGPNIDVFGP
jgi:hypothetical protein